MRVFQERKVSDRVDLTLRRQPLCDSGIRASAAGFPREAAFVKTLVGLSKELHAFWKKHLESRGYHIKFQIADWPDGMPGDISMTLMWR